MPPPMFYTVHVDHALQWPVWGCACVWMCIYIYTSPPLLVLYSVCWPCTTVTVSAAILWGLSPLERHTCQSTSEPPSSPHYRGAEGSRQLACNRPSVTCKCHIAFIHHCNGLQKSVRVICIDVFIHKYACSNMYKQYSYCFTKHN